MVSVRFNQKWWGHDYDWVERGDEWSAPWGGPDAQWYGSLYPRIHRFLPTGHILEIASGHGRWTQYLKDHCDQLTGVDLSQVCVDACRERFAGDEHLTFQTTDGISLPGVADASIDFAFSFDSLVHADQSVIKAYLVELRRVLKSDGAALIHHSNLGAYARRYAPINAVPKLGGALRRAGLLQSVYMRDATVSAAWVAAEAEQHGLRVISQEVTPWRSHRTFVDCTSVIVPEESPAVRENRVVRNRMHGSEPSYVARISQLYGAGNGR